MYVIYDEGIQNLLGAGKTKSEAWAVAAEYFEERNVGRSGSTSRYVRGETRVIRATARLMHHYAECHHGSSWVVSSSGGADVG